MKINIKFAGILTVHIAFFFLGVNLARAYTNQQIDSILDESISYIQKGMPDSAIACAFQIVELSESVDYEKGVIKGLIIIADILAYTNQHEKSIEFIKKIEEHSTYLSRNPYEAWYSQMLKVDNYRFLKLSALGRKAFIEAAQVLDQIKDPYQKAVGQFNMYSLAPEIFNDQPDTMYHYLNKARQVLESDIYNSAVDTNHYMRNKNELYCAFGNYHLEREEIDSALFYFYKSEKLTEAFPDDYNQSLVLEGVARVALKTKNYDKAVKDFKEAIAISKRFQMYDRIILLYDELINIYGQIGNNAEQQHYLLAQKALKDSLENDKGQARDLAILDIINKKESEIAKVQQQQQLYNILIMVLVFASIAIMCYIFIRFKKRRKLLIEKNKEQIEEKHQQMEQARSEVTQLNNRLNENERAAQVLRLKVNETFDELRTMAIENDPQFLLRFQEVYPEFVEKLLTINSDLKNTELHLCAYIYMDFSTKEMAEYTFKSVKTIQNRKNSLRKRLSIDSSTDLSLWMRALG